MLTSHAADRCGRSILFPPRTCARVREHIRRVRICPQPRLMVWQALAAASPA